MSNQRSDALQTGIDLVLKQWGKGAIIRFSDTPEAVPSISSGSLSLDVALGGCGYPRGRIIEIFGPESSGKTTLALHAIASAQKLGGEVMFVDVEHAIDQDWATKIGVDVRKMLLVQPTSGEEALSIVLSMVKTNAVDLIVVDSVAALTPKNELDGEIGDQHVGGQARLMSQALRMLTPAIATSKTIVIFINQLREKIGVMWGSPEVTPGGRALKFYSSIRIDVRKGIVLKEGEEMLGIRMKVKVVKNKVAPPFKTCELDILGNGISIEGDAIDVSVENGVIKKRGSHLDFGDVKLGNGRDKCVTFLVENPDVLAAIRDAVLRITRSGV